MQQNVVFSKDSWNILTHSYSFTWDRFTEATSNTKECKVFNKFDTMRRSTQLSLLVKPFFSKQYNRNTISTRFITSVKKLSFVHR